MTKEHSMSSTWVLRGILVALTAAIAIALIVNGNVVIGGLLAAVALTRAVLFARVHRQREEFRRRLDQRRTRPGGPWAQ
jgi:hypothetical protein